MNELIKLSRLDIETKYLDKPILIVDKNNNHKKWYLVSDIDTKMPLHLLNGKESELHDQDESSIDGIEVVDAEGNGYCLWIYFSQSDDRNGWEAFGYE